MSKHLKTKERASEERKTNLWRPEVDVENNNSDRYAVENMSSEYADMLMFWHADMLRMICHQNMLICWYANMLWIICLQDMLVVCWCYADICWYMLIYCGSFCHLDMLTCWCFDICLFALDKLSSEGNELRINWIQNRVSKSILPSSPT